MIMTSTATIATGAAAAATGRILDLLIIGGGLSGVMVANDFHHRTTSTTTSTNKNGSGNNDNTNTSESSKSTTTTTKSWCLLEARSVLGGRLTNDSMGHTIDLGGAWVWPSHQPNLRRLIPELDSIEVFEQPDDPSSTRIVGGAVQLVHSLANDLPTDNILLNTPVTKCSLVSVPTTTTAEETVVDQVCLNAEEGNNDNEGSSGASRETLIRVETLPTNDNNGDSSKSSTSAADGSSVFYARQVVIAVPPRLIAKHITFDPPLSPPKQRAMESSHTWMAGVTKVSLVYPTRFWNDDVSNMGLPSHMGPAFQVYDASTKDGSVSALTFFAITKTEEERQWDDKTLGTKVASQIAAVWKYFGHSDMANQAMYFENVHVQRWPNEKYISEDPKPTTIQPHPHPIGVLSRNEWNASLLFAGSEADQRSAGVMEGAIGSAKRVMKDIQV